MDAKSWFGLFAPVATPAPVISKLSGAISKAVLDSSVQLKLKEMGADPNGDQHEAFQKYVLQEVRRWGVLVERSGATVD